MNDDNWAKMIKPIGEPYTRESFTYTCDDQGNTPPFDQWERHEVEVVVIETSKLNELIRLANLARLRALDEK